MSEHTTKHAVSEDAASPEEGSPLQKQGQRQPRRFKPFSVLPPPPPHPPPTLASRTLLVSPQGHPDQKPSNGSELVVEEKGKMTVEENANNELDLDDIVVMEKSQNEDGGMVDMDTDEEDDLKQSGTYLTPTVTSSRKKVGARRKRLGNQSEDSEDQDSDPDYANIGVEFTAELEGENADESIRVDLIHPKVRKEHRHDRESEVKATDGEVQLRESSTEPEERRKRKRPNSNYRNMAPLPPPTSNSPEPYLQPLLVTKTTGESSSSTKDISLEVDGTHTHGDHLLLDTPAKPPVRVKPRNRAPIPPPPITAKRKPAGPVDEIESKKPSAMLEKPSETHQPSAGQLLVRPALHKSPSAPPTPGPPIKPPRQRHAADKPKSSASLARNTNKQTPSKDSKHSPVPASRAEAAKIVPSKGGGVSSTPEEGNAGQLKTAANPHPYKRAPPPPPGDPSSSSTSTKDLESIENKELSTETYLTPGTSLRQELATDKTSPTSKHKLTPSRTAPPPPPATSSSHPLHKAPQQDSTKNPEALEADEPPVPPLPPKPTTFIDSPEPSVHSKLDLDHSQSEDKGLSVVSEHVARTLSAMKLKAQSIQENMPPVSESCKNSQNTPAGYEMLSKMDYFSVQLNKNDGQGYGMQIAEGTCQTNKGHKMKGVFVVGVKPGSPAEASGRIRAQDMLLEIAGVAMIGSSLDDAAKLLKSSGNTVKVKLGRAQVVTDTVESPTTVLSAQELMASQGENAKLQDKITELERELSQSKDAESDLTQALGKVTIEKTRMEREIQKLRDRASSHSNDQVTKLAEVLATNKSLRAQLDEANSQIQALETELQTSRETGLQLQSENTSLTKKLEETMQELDKERANMSRSSEELTNLRSELELERTAREKAEQNLAQMERQVVTAAHIQAEKQTSHESDSVEETNSPLPPPVGPKPEEKEKLTNDESPPERMPEPEETPVEENVEEVTGSKKVPPSAEAAIVEKEDEKEKDSETKSEEATLTLVDDAKESNSEFDDEEFDQVGSMKCLDNTSAIEKAQLFSKKGRKRPSRRHIQSMANMSAFPDEMPQLKVLEGSASTGSIPSTGNPPPKPRKPEAKLPPKPKPSEPAKPQPQAPARKPKPRPQPRKKPSPEHRSATPETPTTHNTISEVSKKPVPIPHSPSRDSPVSSEDIDPSTTAGEKPASPPESLSQSPPVPSSKKVPIIPHKSPKSSPVHARKSPISSPVHAHKTVIDEPPTSVSPAPPKKPKPHPPKPSPRSHKSDDAKPAAEKPSTSADGKLEELQAKDPSELTVKEKMMLAQVAMARQAEQKSKGLPPLIRKRPPIKSPSVDHFIDDRKPPVERESVHEPDVDSSMERSRSMDNMLEDGQSTPNQRRKLPPGAFNISIPVGLPGEMRHRSATHAGITSPDHTKRFSEEVDHAQTDHQHVPPHVTPRHEADQALSPDLRETPSRRSGVLETFSSEGTPQHSGSAISTPEANRRDMVANSSGMDESEDDLDGEDEADGDPDALMQQVSSSPSSKPDPEQVLYWSPEVVGIWLRNIGLGKHSSTFIEKNIKGYILFDLDASKLKGLGVSSSDEKSVFKKEVKVLRPFAEKIKREYDKAKKEEKKRAEQEKKIAKKKKK